MAILNPWLSIGWVGLASIAGGERVTLAPLLWYCDYFAISYLQSKMYSKSDIDNQLIDISETWKETIYKINTSEDLIIKSWRAVKLLPWRNNHVLFMWANYANLQGVNPILYGGGGNACLHLIGLITLKPA